jgi:hypothetical protein
MLDGFLWWTGCVFWVAWLGLLLTALGNGILKRGPGRQVQSGQKERA